MPTIGKREIESVERPITVRGELAEINKLLRAGNNAEIGDRLDLLLKSPAWTEMVAKLLDDLPIPKIPQ